MMVNNSDLAASLQELRDVLRNPTALTPDDLSFRLSSTLQSLGLHRTSLSSSHVLSADLKAITRYLPSIQSLLIADIIPTFLPTLDGQSQEDLKTFFVPAKRSNSLSIRRQTALVSYLSLPSYLNNPKPNLPSLPKQSRQFVISILASLTAQYSIDDVYYAIFGSDVKIGGEGKEEGSSSLNWQDAVKGIVGLPAKAGNAIGRWNSEAGGGVDMSDHLLPKVYFDNLIAKFEGLIYELAHNASSSNLSPIQLVLEKLAAIGLITQPTSYDSRSPSLFPALLPPLLKHLHPPSSSPLAPYPTAYLATLFMSLPSTSLTSFIDCLLAHLTYRLIDPSSPLEPDVPDQRIKRAVDVFAKLVGPAKVGGEAWNAVSRILSGIKGTLSLREDRQQARNRVIIAWIAQEGHDAVKAFIEQVVGVWTEPKYIKFTLYAQQLNLTHMLLLALSSLPPFSSWLLSLSRRPKFIMAFQSYLSHPDPSIRRLGMVVAEILSDLTIPESKASGSTSKTNEEIEELKKGLELDEDGMESSSASKAAAGGPKRLKFTRMWDGNGQGKEECRWLRKAIGTNDMSETLDADPTGQVWLLGWTESTAHDDTVARVTEVIQSERTRGREVTPTETRSRGKHGAKPKQKPKIVMLDPDQLDDPLQGYASSSPSSSRSPSPTPSYLEEITADPSLALGATQKKKVTRPVYIPQLVALLKERDKPESIEMALKWGEGLVRAKREFGTELAENAVGAVLMTIGLNDPFHIEGFEENRQGLMNALVACSPKEVAPFLCEQYFNTQFSLQQKSVILTALAMGAREMAGLPVPQAQSVRRIDFPSKTLPPALHRKYISDVDVPLSRRITSQDDRTNGQLEEAVAGLRGLVLGKSARKGGDVPEIARERRLKVGSSKKTMVAELGTLSASQMAQTRSTAPVHALKDIAAEYFIMPLINRFWLHFNESTTWESRAVASGSRYRGAGTGMVLSPMALEKFLMTLAILLHAARHSPVFLSVLCPEALELAISVGSRRPAHNPDDDLSVGGAASAEAQVVGSALEVCLVALDTSFELDSGRTLALDKPALVLGVGEWATHVFQNETEGGAGGGETASGQGGQEGRIRANAAGVVLKVGEIGEKWGHLGLRF